MRILRQRLYSIALGMLTLFMTGDRTIVGQESTKTRGSGRSVDASREDQIRKLSDEDLDDLIDKLSEGEKRLRVRDSTINGWNQYLDEKYKLSQAFNLAKSNFTEGPKNITDEAKARISELDRVERDLRFATSESFRRNFETRWKDLHARHAELYTLAPQELPDLSKQEWNPATFPRIDGSTSTQPLAMLIACRTMQQKYKWSSKNPITQTYQIDGWATLQFGYYDRKPSDFEAWFALYYMQSVPAIERDSRLADFLNYSLVRNSSTHQAYLNVVDGACDLAIIARPPINSEIEYALSKNVQIEVSPCAKDALVFLVNGTNELDNLTVEQARGIYTNKITNWKEVGWNDTPILPFRRPSDSGSEPWMHSLVMKGEAMSPTVSDDLVQQEMNHVFLSISEKANSMGYSIWYYERFMTVSSGTKVLKINGIEPTAENLRNGSYPLIGEVVVVMRSDTPADSPTRRLRDWLLSPEGQKVVTQSGYVPIK